MEDLLFLPVPILFGSLSSGGADLFDINAQGGAAGQSIIITDFTNTDTLQIQIDTFTDTTELSLAPTKHGTGTEVLVSCITHAVLQGITDVEIDQITLPQCRLGA